MYSIAVKIEGVENRRRSAGLLHVVVGFFLIVNASNFYRFGSYKNFWLVGLYLLVASFSLFYGFFRRKIDLSAKYNFKLRLLQVACFISLGFLLLQTGRTADYFGVFIFAFLCIVLLFSERRIFQETTIDLKADGVKMPGYYTDHVSKWEELAEVVVREDFITLFYRNEKYQQFQVMQDLSTLEVAKMNAFCKEKIDGFLNSEERRHENPAAKNSEF